MDTELFPENVRTGGLTSKTQSRILLCYLLDNTPTPLTRQELEAVLLGDSLVNYFVLADALAQLEQQQLIETTGGRLTLTTTGQTVARTLADEVPRTVRDAAVRGVVRLQQYAAKAAAHHCTIETQGDGKRVQCSIGDETGTLFALELYMPDALSAEAVRDNFVTHGDEVFKLVLAALTQNKVLLTKALDAIGDAPASK